MKRSVAWTPGLDCIGWVDEEATSIKDENATMQWEYVYNDGQYCRSGKSCRLLKWPSKNWAACNLAWFQKYYSTVL